MRVPVTTTTTDTIVQSAILFSLLHASVILLTSSSVPNEGAHAQYSRSPAQVTQIISPLLIPQEMQAALSCHHDTAPRMLTRSRCSIELMTTTTA